MKRPSAGGLLRLVVAAALVTYALWQSDPRAVWRACAEAAAWPLLAAAGLVIADRALMAYRWFALLKPLEPGGLPPFRTIMRIFFVSSFVGTFLPGSIGNDLARAYGLSRHAIPTRDAVASVFLDRMLGVLSVLLVALLGLLLTPRELWADAGVLTTLAITVAVCGATGLLIFSTFAGRIGAGMLGAVPWEAGRRLASGVMESIRRYAHHHGVLARVLAGSAAVQLLRVVQAYYLGAALGITQPLTTYLAFIPLILLIMLLPVTISGIGTSQVAFLWLFSRVGTPAADAVALSVLFVALGIIGNLPGAFLWVWEKPFPAHPRR